MSTPSFRSGFVTLIGRPNAGKSTLINAIMGDKIAITSSTAQTTRHRFRAIYDTDECQIVLVDTPGMHKPHDALGEELNRSAVKSLEDVDVVALLIDASAPVGAGDKWVAQHIKNVRAHRILVISKADLATKEESDAQIAAMTELMNFDDVVVLSAKDNYNIQRFLDAVYNVLPEGPRWFPEGTKTDQPEEVLVAEFIREKILLLTRDELPHAIGVQVDDMHYDRKKDLESIMATVYVERESQKGIIIGKRGSMIKEIGTQARADLERLLGAKVFLDLRVKVKRDWRRDAAQIRRFGYGEGL